MPSQAESSQPRGSVSTWSSDVAVLAYLATATVVVHLLTGGRYGFHRDELATLDDARHLAWGYVAYPPITPFFARISLTFFGTSLVGFRLFVAIAQAIAVVLTGLMARELGGGRGAHSRGASSRPGRNLSAGQRHPTAVLHDLSKWSALSLSP